MKNTKTLAYAYPTSTNASLLGFGKQGCWYVNGYGFATRAEAIAYGDTLPGEWSLWSLTNPRFSREADSFNHATA